jgi:hypothetical protein
MSMMGELTYFLKF